MAEVIGRQSARQSSDITHLMIGVQVLKMVIETSAADEWNKRKEKLN